MANETAWTHFREIIGVIKRLKDSISQFVKDIERLRVMKEEILDNAELRAELKKIVDVSHDTTMESLVADYTQFQALRDWLEENEYI